MTSLDWAIQYLLVSVLVLFEVSHFWIFYEICEFGKGKYMEVLKILFLLSYLCTQTDEMILRYDHFKLRVIFSFLSHPLFHFRVQNWDP